MDLKEEKGRKKRDLNKRRKREKKGREEKRES